MNIKIMAKNIIIKKTENKKMIFISYKAILILIKINILGFIILSDKMTLLKLTQKKYFYCRE